MTGRRRLAWVPFVVGALLAAGPSAVAIETRDPPVVEVVTPPVGLVGLPARIEVRRAAPPDDAPPERVEIVDPANGTVLASTVLGATGSAVLKIATPPHGRALEVRFPGSGGRGVPFALRAIPGWLSLVPPLLAIALALVFRHVVPALLAGVWAGASLVAGDPLLGALRAVDRYAVGALADSDHASIVIFTVFLGGMVGVISRAGGTAGMVETLAPWATTSRRGLLASWAMGVLIFFDDYANTLIVGNTMRPVTDRLRISREKLAYVVDATAAPVASIALISTWIGYEVSLIGDALAGAGVEREAYGVFLRSLPYNFYPWLALLLGFGLAASRRDFGPMWRAECRAAGGEVLRAGSVPLADFDHAALQPAADRPRRWINAALPVLLVLAVTFAALWLTGRADLVAKGDPRGTAGLAALGIEGLGGVLGAGDSYASLLYGSLAGVLAALALATAQRILTLAEGLEAWIGGVKSMTSAMVILILAWSISTVCRDLDAAGFMVAAVSDALAPALFPTVVFALAAATAFATGSSWSTMGILIPLAVPTALGVAREAALDPGAAERILLAAVSAVLAGAVFGDHCSPISDTTVLSSMAAGCDHVDHVRTQAPYALVAGGVAIVAGYVPAGFGCPPLVCLALSAAALLALVGLLGRRVPGAA